MDKSKSLKVAGLLAMGMLLSLKSDILFLIIRFSEFSSSHCLVLRSEKFNLQSDCHMLQVWLC